jgi:hypothetical protein
MPLTESTYVLCGGDAVTEVDDASPAKVLTGAAPLPQEAPTSITCTALVDARPTPDNCSVHGSDSVHPVDATSAPEIWKDPISNAYVASWPQQRRKLPLAVPDVAVPKSKRRKSTPDAPTLNVAPV